MTEVSFKAINSALERVKLPKCELVVGIAQGGIVPACLVASKIDCDLKIVRFNYRNEENTPQHPDPILLDSIALPKNVKSILLVDDVSISGKTLKAAKKVFKDYAVTTMVFRGKADFVLFPEIATCVKWPWRP